MREPSVACPAPPTGGATPMSAHSTRSVRGLDPIERFWSHLDATGDCWEWTGCRRDGYGLVWWLCSMRSAHRIAYELLVEPIPDRFTIDHLCRNRGCLNPDHMEVVSIRVNTLRGYGRTAMQARRIHCPQGHVYDSPNIYRPRSGSRQCRACKRLRDKRRRRHAPKGIR